MAQYGIGEFVYELTVENDQAKFKFFDPNDVSNTAEVSLGRKDFPEGVTQPDSRQVADVAFAQCAKVLNDKRDARVQKEQAEALKKQQELDTANRETAQDFFNNSQDLANTTATGSPATAKPDQAAPAHTPREETEADKGSKKK